MAEVPFTNNKGIHIKRQCVTSKKIFFNFLESSYNNFSNVKIPHTYIHVGKEKKKNRIEGEEEEGRKL